MATKEELVTLHKYFLNASQMKSHLDTQLRSLGDNASAGDIPALWSYLSLWYGCLRVVIEGWHSLELSDADVDHLLLEDKIVLLNGFRNDTFHFKPDYYSTRTVRLLDDQEFSAWIRSLHNPIGLSILRQMQEA